MEFYRVKLDFLRFKIEFFNVELDLLGNGIWQGGYNYASMGDLLYFRSQWSHSVSEHIAVLF